VRRPPSESGGGWPGTTTVHSIRSRLLEHNGPEEVPLTAIIIYIFTGIPKLLLEVLNRR
jgi:hypothetical protein